MNINFNTNILETNIINLACGQKTILIKSIFLTN